MRHSYLLIPLMIAGCASDAEHPHSPAGSEAISVAELRILQSSRIFFGHQSLGADVLTGIAEIAPELPIASTEDLSRIPEFGLWESSIGQNGDPSSKDIAFLNATAMLDAGDVALYKYCYVDMHAETDPDALFASYQHTLDLAARNGVRTLAVTMPITTVAPRWKYWVKTLLGRDTERELNAKRQRFNDLIRDAAGARPLIDLARWEATLESGESNTTLVSGRAVETLASVFTHDGAHLNPRGRRHVASLFLRTLSAAIVRASDP